MTAAEADGPREIQRWTMGHLTTTVAASLVLMMALGLRPNDQVVSVVQPTLW